VRDDGSGEFLLVEDGSYPEPPNPLLVYRRLPYGDLAEVFGVDTQIGLPGHGLTQDATHLPASAPTLYGRPQYEWFTQGLLESEQRGVTWKLVANQAWFAPADIPDSVDLPKLGISRWVDYQEEREAVCRFLRGENPASTRVHGTIFVSGDAHGNFGSDVVENVAHFPDYRPGPGSRNPRNGSTPENVGAGQTRSATGGTATMDARAASVAVEFAPSSMGRGGADEIVKNGNPNAPFAAQVAGARTLEGLLFGLNPNIQFLEWVDHGYGIVDLRPERAVFEFWWQDKTTPGSPDVLGMQMVTWAQDDPSATSGPRRRDQIDAVELHGMATEATSGDRASRPAPAFVANPR
jgi:alkaline phosphatase D